MSDPSRDHGHLSDLNALINTIMAALHNIEAGIQAKSNENNIMKSHRPADIGAKLATPCSANLNSTPNVILTPLEISSYPTDGRAVRQPAVGSVYRDEMPADNIQNTNMDSPTAQELPGVVETRAPRLRAQMRRLSRHSSLVPTYSDNSALKEKVGDGMEVTAAENFPSEGAQNNTEYKYIDNSGRTSNGSLDPQRSFASDYFYTQGPKICRVQLRFAFNAAGVLSVKLCVSHAPGAREDIWPIYFDGSGKVFNRETDKPTPLWTLKKKCDQSGRGEEKEIEANISLVTKDESFQKVTFELLEKLGFVRGNCFKFFWEVTTS